MAEDGVHRQEGTVQSYKESVHHQFASTISNLKSLEKYSKQMYQDYWDGRKCNVSGWGICQSNVCGACNGESRKNQYSSKKTRFSRH